MKIIADIQTMLRRFLALAAFRSSQDYWVARYKAGGNSGHGSYGALARYKAEVINQFVETHSIRTMIEYGCGDGHQLSLAKYPRYSGYDISPDAIARCKNTYRDDPSKNFYLIREYRDEKAELALSLDVVYHLVEDRVFEDHLRVLFNSSEKYVIVFSTNSDHNILHGPHIKHRCFTAWVERNLPGWELIAHLPSQQASADRAGELSKADFFIYQKADRSAGAE